MLTISFVIISESKVKGMKITTTGLYRSRKKAITFAVNGESDRKKMSKLNYHNSERACKSVGLKGAKRFSVGTDLIIMK